MLRVGSVDVDFISSGVGKCTIRSLSAGKHLFSNVPNRNKKIAAVTIVVPFSQPAILLASHPNRSGSTQVLSLLLHEAAAQSISLVGERVR